MASDLDLRELTRRDDLKDHRRLMGRLATGVARCRGRRVSTATGEVNVTVGSSFVDADGNRQMSDYRWNSVNGVTTTSSSADAFVDRIGKNH